MNWLIKLEQLFEDFLINFFHDPLETNPATLPMNLPPEPITPPITISPPRVSAADKLKITALAWIGRDASPLNRAPQEISCAEGVVNLVNMTWPGTLSESVLGTDELYQALLRSKRFKGVLEPVGGCIEVSPRTMTVNGHTGIYVDSTRIASNDSRTGKFNINYTRQSWRDAMIKGRGLKAYLFVPVD